MKRLLRHAGLALCAAALLQLSGGVYAISQGIAWGRMLVDYSRSFGVKEGISRTFDGQHPCSACLAIKKEKSKETRDRGGISFQLSDLKLVLAKGTPGVFTQALFRPLELASVRPMIGSSMEPDVPPPRAV
jgi:hypothetical protein